MFDVLSIMIKNEKHQVSKLLRELSVSIILLDGIHVCLIISKCANRNTSCDSSLIAHLAIVLI